MKLRSIVAALHAIILLPGLGFASPELPSPTELRARLRAFQTDSATEMSRIPPKQTRSGRKVMPKFSAFDRASGRYVEAKDAYRSKNRKLPLPGRAPMKPHDMAQNLVDQPAQMVLTLEQMEQRSLRKARVAVDPWSDDYWPIDKGITARRFHDDKFPNHSNWAAVVDFYKSNPDSSSVDDLSPAEKYDLLVGATGEDSLRAYQVAEGEQYSKNGKVEDWMGICHGWAPAAYMLKRPRNAITVTAADGKTKILFYPSDIKALSSLLWANARVPSRFVGGRCNAKKPKRDDSGRVTNEECFDTNPGTWHLAVVNQIGVNRRSFVFDATYDYEVWNQPVVSYSYQFFNPQTSEPANSIDQAKVAIERFTKDKFKKYRSNEAKSVVGVNMSVEYTSETSPSTARSDSEEYDNVAGANYSYDLELDARGNIIGGEWYTNAHPDFLWTPAPGARALAYGEPVRFRSSWNLNQAMPTEMQETARRSLRYSQPLGAIVEALVTQAALAR